MWPFSLLHSTHPPRKHGSESRRRYASCSQRSTVRLELETLEERNLLSVYVVTNTSNDAGVSGSLPWAVQQANMAQGLNYIDFNIPGSGMQIINIGTTLSLNSQVVIDGTSQPGYNGSPLITVQGGTYSPSLFYLGSGSSGSTIQGLDMYEFTGNAVTIDNSSSGNWIQNNWMGFYRDPSTGQDWLNYGAYSNTGAFSSTGAIGIQSSYNTIRNNVMSGTYNAVRMGEDPAAAWSGTTYVGNAIESNYIGTDPTGATSWGYGNQSDAIFLGSGCQNNYLGPDNVLSGNPVHGVELLAPSVTGNVIFRNYIGTDVTGRYAIPNGDGVLIANGAHGNAVGGPWGGNVISGNTLLAVSLGLANYGTGNGNWVQYNIIGLNGSQTGVIGAGTFGISINNGSSGNDVQNNAIAGASQNAVVLSNTQGNYITNNWIGESGYGTGFANGDFGIALLAGANYNTILQNAMGINRVGPYYVDPNAYGNYIR